MDQVVVRLSAPVDAAAAAALCLALRQRLASRPPQAARTVVCHVLGPVDVSVVGVLARMQVMARRLQATLQVRVASADLPGLIALTGLEHALPACLEPGWQPETLEDRGIQEVVDVPDRPV